MQKADYALIGCFIHKTHSTLMIIYSNNPNRVAIAIGKETVTMMIRLRLPSCHIERHLYSSPPVMSSPFSALKSGHAAQLRIDPCHHSTVAQGKRLSWHDLSSTKGSMNKSRWASHCKACLAVSSTGADACII